MPNIAKFKVLVPATAINGPTAMIDNRGLYAGVASEIPEKGARHIGSALVMGGTEVGGAVRGCTYITSQFPVPGFGEITYE